MDSPPRNHEFKFDRSHHQTHTHKSTNLTVQIPVAATNRAALTAISMFLHSVTITLISEFLSRLRAKSNGLFTIAIHYYYHRQLAHDQEHMHSWI
jgi:hypothetical protein